jgi:hypothetical protein
MAAPLKLTSSGVVLWTTQFGTAEDDSANGVAIDPTNNILVLGSSGGTLPNQINRYCRPAFVRKYSPSGALLWSHVIETPTLNSRVQTYAISVNGLGESVIAGMTNGQFPGQTSLGNEDAFVVKLDALGNTLWARQFGTGTYDGAYGAAFDGAGNVLVTGYTWGTLPGMVKAGMGDAFLRKYDPLGNEVWTRQFGSMVWYFRGINVAADAAGSVYVAFERRRANSSVGIAKYDSLGNVAWSTTVVAYEPGFAYNPSERDISPADIRVDAAGNVVLLANNKGHLDPAAGRAGSETFLLQKRSSNGVVLWSREFGNGRFNGYGFAIEPSGTLLVAGDVTFGTSSDALVVRTPP